MLHSVDSTEAPIPCAPEHAPRREWMGVLARTDEQLLEDALGALDVPGFVWLRRPETGLMMVRARAGGTGERFNFGEMTVTRCALRLQGGQGGVAYVQGRSHRKAELAALADALMQSPAHAEQLQGRLLAPARERLQQSSAALRQSSQSTRVEFFTVAREAGA